jgi:putative phosphoribosyl transferase
LAGTAEVDVPLGNDGVPGVLTLPPHARGVIVFADGTAAGNAAVDKALIEARFGTLLAGLVAREERRLELRRSADRVTGAIDWLTGAALIEDLPPSLAGLPVGCFGSGTGAAAALVAAAERPDRIVAVVACGGRLDLAGPALRRVRAPTLLIAGCLGGEALRLDREAQAELAGESRLEMVPGAGPLFDEPGAPERVSALARDWFLRHIG